MSPNLLYIFADQLNGFSLAQVPQFKKTFC